MAPKYPFDAYVLSQSRAALDALKELIRSSADHLRRLGYCVEPVAGKETADKSLALLKASPFQDQLLGLVYSPAGSLE